MDAQGRSLVGGLVLTLALILGSALPAAARPPTAPTADVYGIDFVATAASGVDMNDAGDIIGTSRLDTGCGSTCLPPEDTVVWRGGQRIVLPPVAFSPMIFTVDINDNGWIAGFAGFPGSTTHAVVWKPVGGGYQSIDLGNLPGKQISLAAGIDDQNRVVGWSTTTNFPPVGLPYLWTEAGGMVDLTSLGFPADQPLAISPGGTVGTADAYYLLDDPGSVTDLPAPPGDLSIGTDQFEINDAGDEGRFLVDPPENLLYLFRFRHENGGSWQQISTTPTGHLSTAGVGSITAAGDITATVASAGMVAFGPDGLAQPLSSLVSPAYGGGDTTVGGAMNASGQILSKLIIGQSSRLVRLAPTQACTTNCIRVSSLQMQAMSSNRCDQGDAQARARLTVRSETGAALPNARITGRFMDDYWLDQVVVGQTNATGQVQFTHRGPPCVGAFAFLVTNAETRDGRTFDRTIGTLAGSVIP